MELGKQQLSNDMRNNFNELSSLFGYCPQFDAIFEYLTVYENLKFYSEIKGIKSEYIDRVVYAMIEEMSLGEFIHKRAGRLSGGNKRKLSVAISFLCSPPIVLLDEPSTGQKLVDLCGQLFIKYLLKERKQVLL